MALFRMRLSGNLAFSLACLRIDGLAVSICRRLWRDKNAFMNKPLFFSNLFFIFAAELFQSLLFFAAQRDAWRDNMIQAGNHRSHGPGNECMDAGSHSLCSKAKRDARHR